MAMNYCDFVAWFEEGKKLGATHMIIVCDTFDHEDYPVYVEPGEDVRKKAFEYGSDNGAGLPTVENEKMSRVMEVYSLSLPMKDQYEELRAFHFE